MTRSKQNPRRFDHPDDSLTDLIICEFRRVRVELTPVQTAQFVRYVREVARWSRVVNLTGIQNETGMIRSLLVTSALWPLPAWESGAVSLLDVGSGAGIPGIPLKVLHPEWELTLLDRSRRKGNFLKYVAGLMKLQGLEVVSADLREASHRETWRGHFSGVVSRAAVKLPRLVPACLPLLRPGGILVTQKGEGVEKEIEEVGHSCLRLGGRFEGMQDISDPWGGRLRFVSYRRAAG